MTTVAKWQAFRSRRPAWHRSLIQPGNRSTLRAAIRRRSQIIAANRATADPLPPISPARTPSQYCPPKRQDRSHRCKRPERRDSHRNQIARAALGIPRKTAAFPGGVDIGRIRIQIQQIVKRRNRFVMSIFQPHRKARPLGPIHEKQIEHKMPLARTKRPPACFRSPDEVIRQAKTAHP
jgi:hypothetical protein